MGYILFGRLLVYAWKKFRKVERKQLLVLMRFRRRYCSLFCGGEEEVRARRGGASGAEGGGGAVEVGDLEKE